MQNKTRYVGIQIGIGGWQPFASLTVDKTSYGDCKALSFYTKTLLSYVGVESLYTELGNGETKIKHNDFVSNQTNHAILCVLMPTDTIWLECTSQTAPFNYLGHSSTNRNVLLVDGKNSHLCYIHASADNIKETSSTIQFNDNNKVHLETSKTCSEYFFDKNQYLAHLSSKEYEKQFQIRSSLSDIQGLEYSVNLEKDSAKINIHQNFYASGLITAAGNRLIVDLSPFSLCSSIKKQRKERTTPIDLGEEKYLIDHINFEIPPEYDIEYLPKENKLESEYGAYHFSVVQDGQKITIEKVFHKESGHFDKENYPSFIEFINNISENEHCKLVLKRTQK